MERSSFTALQAAGVTAGLGLRACEPVLVSGSWGFTDKLHGTEQVIAVRAFRRV